MKHLQTITLLTILISFFSCKQEEKEENQLSIEVLHHQIIDGVPSASGVIKSKEEYYVIGDDSPYLFCLDSSFKNISKSPIYSTEKLDDQKIRKEIKPDFEALEMISDEEIYVFGSGSKSPKRDIFLTIALKNALEVKSYNISPFYDSLRNLPILKNKELNIEGIAFNDDKVYLLNRGQNVIFTFNKRHLKNHLTGKHPFPTPKSTLYNLPKINGIESGFSGATISKDKGLLVFTSSVENTGNAYDDGQILGSFVGIIDLSGTETPTTYRYATIPELTKPLKVESVTIDEEISDNESNIIFVTDSDGGHSVLMKCHLKW